MTTAAMAKCLRSRKGISMAFQRGRKRLDLGKAQTTQTGAHLELQPQRTTKVRFPPSLTLQTAHLIAMSASHHPNSHQILPNLADPPGKQKERPRFVQMKTLRWN